MSRESISTQLEASERMKRLRGPYKYHVYLGCSSSNAAVIDRLRLHLQHMQIICDCKFLPGLPQVSHWSLIREGIRCSRKCLIYVTDDYIDELASTREDTVGVCWSRFELNEVTEKAKRISRDVVLVLRKKDLTKSIPQEISECTMLEVTEEMIEHNLDFLNLVVQNILREPCVALCTLPSQNTGYGLALSYFYGFLRLVLPDFRKRLIEETLAGDEHMVRNTVKKLLIIIPESCFCPIRFPNEFTLTNKSVVRVANRAGNAKRHYKSSLYHVLDKLDGENYYFAGEFATPLLTMYESYCEGLAGLTLKDLHTERDAFYISLDTILSHAAHKEYRQQCELLFWRSDPGCHNEETIELYDFLLPIIKDELCNEKDSGLYEELTEEDSAVHQSQQVAYLEANKAEECELPKATFEIVNVHGYYPSAVYDFNFKYDLDVAKHQGRGLCLIINMNSFDRRSFGLQPRLGAQKDVENVTELFERLHFFCQVHHDTPLKTLHTLLLTTSQLDHSAYKAFVCVIMTHGGLGIIYTSDAQPVDVLDIAEYFNDTHCPSLRGKPKMFFIEASQRGSYSSKPSYQPSADTDVETFVGVQLRMKNFADVDETARETILSYGTPAEQDEAEACLERNYSTVPVAPMLQAAIARASTWYVNRARLVPSWPDFLMSYATLPGATAYRDIEAGSLYIRYLCKCLKPRMEIDWALKNVTREVREYLKQTADAGIVHRFQLPFHLTSGMDKHIFL